MFVRLRIKNDNFPTLQGSDAGEHVQNYREPIRMSEAVGVEGNLSGCRL